MKKIKYMLVSIFLFLCILGNCKANSINEIDMEIYIDSYGNAHVTETWNSSLTNGTEGYRYFTNMGNSEITDYSVSMDGKKFSTISNWRINASFNEKAYKAGINENGSKLELCFGISEYGTHDYELSYTITDFVMELNDSQMVYWNLIPRNLVKNNGSVNITIYADEYFDDTLPVWGYDNYGGLAYVYDGKIYMRNEDLSNNESMILLVKFPQNTFNTTNYESKDFEYYKDMADEGIKEYNEGDIPIWLAIILMLCPMITFWVIIIVIILKSSNHIQLNNYDFMGQSSKIKKEEITYYRDLPLGKDIFKAYYLSNIFRLNKKKTDFLGSVLLKWISEDKVKINKDENLKNNALDFSQEFTFENDFEKELYDMMKKASKDNILEKNEFKTWCSKNYDNILNWFDKVIKKERDILVNKGQIIVSEKKILKIFKKKIYSITPSLRSEAVKLAGLKKFLQDFSKISDRSSVEVKLWKEYLMYAQIFGIAEKVAEEFKELYPDYITEDSYSDFIFISNISHSGISSASSARSRANSYSSGGGGFSSGGGGGGSFGGGGGGFR